MSPPWWPEQTRSCRCSPSTLPGRSSNDSWTRPHRPSGGTRNSRFHRATFGWPSLTESEGGVADLVADGLTNREVANRLFLSSHTVDAHLRHIYRKLGIHSRVELTRVVAEHDVRPVE